MIGSSETQLVIILHINYLSTPNKIQIIRLDKYPRPDYMEKLNINIKRQMCKNKTANDVL